MGLGSLNGIFGEGAVLVVSARGQDGNALGALDWLRWKAALAKFVGEEMGFASVKTALKAASRRLLLLDAERGIIHREHFGFQQRL